MKAHEAIAILESLDPSQEVTLTIGAAKRKVGTPNGYLPGQANPSWVIGKEQWVPRDPNVYPYGNDIVCGTNTVH